MSDIDTSTLDRHPDDDWDLFEHVLEHSVEALENADVGTEPFCHFYAENVLPRDFYEKLQLSFPDKNCYEPLNLKVWVRENGESTRDRMVFSDQSLAELRSEQHRIWSIVKSVMDSDRMKCIVFRHLARDIAARFSIPESEVNSLDVYFRTVLIKDTESYTIKPHPDGLERIVTSILYLPPDLSQEDLGTSIYEKQSLFSRLTGRRFKEVKRFPFRPNSLCAFAINRLGARTSWHGVELIGANRGVRNSLLTQYRCVPNV